MLKTSHYSCFKFSSSSLKSLNIVCFQSFRIITNKFSINLFHLGAL